MPLFASFCKASLIGGALANLVVPYPGPTVNTKNGTYSSVHLPTCSTAGGMALTGLGRTQIGPAIRSKDRLYLNIVCPSGLTNASGLPVAVWIYGGRVNKGGGSDKRYDYSYAVQDSVSMWKPFIGVTTNHRLSVWGWLMGSE